MLITRAIATYVVGVFVAAALLAYPIHLTLMVAGIEDVPFHKLVTRLLKVIALVGLWPLLSSLRLNGHAHWGFALRGKAFLPQVVKGFGIGVVILFIVVLALFVSGARVFDQPLNLSWTGVFTIVLKGLIAGLVVGFVEEVWFRGALFSALLKFGNVMAAVFVTAALYALVHFIRADVPVAPGDISWSSGFIVIGNCFGRFSSPAIVDSCLALFAAGVLLSLVRYQTHNIALCIGIHAGWVMTIKTVKSVSQVDRDADWFFLVGTYDGIIGIFAIVWLSGLAIAYYWFGMRR